MDKMARSNGGYSKYIGGNRVKLSADNHLEPEEALTRERLKQFGSFAKQHIWSNEEWNLARRYFDSLSDSELLMNSDLITKYLSNHYEEMVTNSLWEPEIPSGETVIRRYLEFDKFLQLIANEYLWFSRSDVFEDEYEGAFPTPRIKKQKEIDQMRMDEIGIPQEDIGWEDSARQGIVEQSNKSTYVNCWRRGESESSIFWNAYIGDNLGVAVETTVDKFRKFVDMEVSAGYVDLVRLMERVRSNFGHHHLRYDLEDLIILELSKLQIGNMKYINYEQDTMPNSEFSRFYHKRNAFSDEQEFRALFRNSSSETGRKDDSEGIRVSIEPDQMIDNIWLKPNSPDWFENLVCGIIEKFGIDQKIVRKSKLDKLKVEQEKAIPGEHYSLMNVNLNNPNDSFGIDGRFGHDEEILPPIHKNPIHKHK